MICRQKFDKKNRQKIHLGYELGGDGKTCVDVDECSFLNGGCDQVRR